ncbi:response regulator transcription factor [Nocardiopsis suaedae]|uniref:Response regulator transcription factor n=1 Tax=Nocardiopsis suaedae TaxID=3018444 RepID=A0ABT4TJ15_9ACTN|nr:response regulator transcription factor [Nocardiopsis suaedae]MDA2804688.1 response regulator transcription factor [Nocardiopsis suaedae]
MAEDEAMTREAIAALLDLEPDITVVAQTEDGSAALAAALEHAPDIVMLDVEMPEGGLALLEKVKKHLPDTRCVILTRHASPGALRRSLKAGADGFIAKNSSAKLLSNVLRRVVDGHRYVDPYLAADALAEPACPLNERELAILAQVSQTSTTADIARNLHLANGTVRNYLSAILDKLNVRSRYEAAELAREQDWI